MSRYKLTNFVMNESHPRGTSQPAMGKAAAMALVNIFLTNPAGDAMEAFVA